MMFSVSGFAVCVFCVQIYVHDPNSFELWFLSGDLCAHALDAPDHIPQKLIALHTMWLSSVVPRQQRAAAVLVS
jgi:hypothetical protein